MTVRWRLSTSSYLRTFLRISKFCASTWACADWIERGDHLGLDRQVVLELGRGHDPVDQARVEQPHQVVLEREVEPRLARVALAAGTATQLVVDAARLVALGAEHVEAAELGDLVVLGGDDRLGAGSSASGQAASYSSGVSSGSSPRSLRAATARNSALPPSMMSVPRPAMLVATVTAPLRPASATIVGLALVVLGVEHLVRRRPLRRSWSERCSDFSTLTVPTSTGWPFCVPLDDVVDDGLVLRLLGLVDEVGLVDADHRRLVGIGTTPSL